MSFVLDKIPKSSIEYVNSIIEDEEVTIHLKKNRKICVTAPQALA